MTYSESKMLEETGEQTERGWQEKSEAEDEGLLTCAIEGCWGVDAEPNTKLCMVHFMELVENQKYKWGEPRYEV